VVIRAARLFKEAAALCAEGNAPGQVTLKVDNYQMSVTASARDEAASASLGRMEEFIGNPQKAALSAAGRGVLALLRDDLRPLQFSIKFVGKRTVEADETFWESIASALDEPMPDLPFIERTTIDALVVGVRASKGRCLVQLRTSFGVEEFEATDDAKPSALRCFEQPVRAHVELERAGRQIRGLTVLALESFQPASDIVAGFAKARTQLANRGVRITPSDWADGDV